MQDRVPLYPGRVKLIPVVGQDNVYDMERADQPTQPGTPLNKNTFLKDTTASKYGLGVDATPDDILNNLVSAAVAAKYKLGVDAVPSDLFDILSKAALVGEDGGLVTPAGSSVAQVNMESGTYIGTGKHGSSGKSSISYTKKPDLILVSGKGDGEFESYSSMALLRGVPEYRNSNYGQGIIFLIDKIEWGDKSVSWYSTMSAGAQANLSSQTYQYTLFFRG